MLLTVLLVGYEAHLDERIVNKWRAPMAGFLDGQPDEKNFHKVLDQTVADLNSHKTLASTANFYCRIEKSVRDYLKQNNADLNHSHALMAIGIAASQPYPNSSARAALEKYCALNYNAAGKLVMDLEGLDSFTAGTVFLEMYEQTGQEFYRQGAEAMAHYLTGTYPKNKLGVMAYWADKPDFVLVDDKGMVCGFLIHYGVRFHDPEALNLGLRHLRAFLAHGVNLPDGLPFHAYDVSLDRKFGPTTWLRGSGWLAMGLGDALAYLPKDHEARAELSSALVKMLETLRGYQEPDGCWRWDVNNPMAPLDTSGTAMIGYAIERALQTGAIDPSWGGVSEKAMRGILHHTHTNGLVDQALADCNGVGHYPCSFGPSNHTQGATLVFFSLVRQRLSATSSAH